MEEKQPFDPSAKEEPMIPTEEASAAPSNPPGEADTLPPVLDGTDKQGETFIQSTPSPAAPTVTLNDRTVVHRFRTAPLAAFEKLNADFDLELDASKFATWQAYFAKVAGRDPTVGELRVLNALDRIPADVPCGYRHAIGTLSTDSPALAETWSDMMQKHAVLHRNLGDRRFGEDAIPPCTFDDALSLTTRYLRRTGARIPASRSDSAVAVLSTERQEAEAATAGFRPTARVVTESGTQLTVAIRPGAPLRETAPRNGDIILYCPQTPLSAVIDLWDREQHKKLPDVGALRAITRRPLFSVLAELCPGALLYADRLKAHTSQQERSFVPLDIFCGIPTCSNGRVDLLMRTSVKRAFYLVEELRRAGITAITLGVVRTDERTILYLRDETNTRDLPAVDLPTELFTLAAGVLLHSYTPTVIDTPPMPIPPSRMALLPGCAPTESGLNPMGREIVALTSLPASVPHVTIGSVHLSTTDVCITVPGQGYDAAGAAVDSVVRALGDIDLRRVSLSVALTAEDGVQAPGSMTVEAICGLYRAAAERGLPIDMPSLTVGHIVDTPAVRLSVTAYMTDAPQTQKAKKSVPESKEIPLADDCQWNSTPKLIHKESPPFLLPVLRRSCEGSLRAITTALNRRDGADCQIFPVAIDMVTADVTANADVTEGTSSEESTATYEQLNPVAVQNLITALDSQTTPIFTMSESDARLLLAEPHVYAAVERIMDMGYPIIVLGEACRAFADHGFLPATLSHLTVLPAAGQTAEVTYRFPGIPVPSATRLVRRDLLTPHEIESVEAFLTVTLSNGQSIPDAFIGREGLVLGVLNGLDTALIDFIRRPAERFTD